jgi:hypothetical protein
VGSGKNAGKASGLPRAMGMGTDAVFRPDCSWQAAQRSSPPEDAIDEQKRQHTLAFLLSEVIVKSPRTPRH